MRTHPVVVKDNAGCCHSPTCVIPFLALYRHYRLPDRSTDYHISYGYISDDNLLNIIQASILTMGLRIRLTKTLIAGFLQSVIHDAKGWSRTSLVTEAGTQHANVEPLSREHRYTQTEKDKEPPIYHTQQCDRRSGIRAEKIKGVVTVYNKSIKISCFILSYHIVIKDV